MLTVLWDRFAAVAVILIVRVPNRPSRPKISSIVDRTFTRHGILRPQW
jgi:hypothetical protein